jgi:hypothetical protein
MYAKHGSGYQYYTTHVVSRSRVVVAMRSAEVTKSHDVSSVLRRLVALFPNITFISRTLCLQNQTRFELLQFQYDMLVVIR